MYCIYDVVFVPLQRNSKSYYHEEVFVIPMHRYAAMRM